jgi:hypothetical protein
MLLCSTGLFLVDRPGLLFYLPVLDRLIDEVGQSRKGASGWMMLDKPGGRITDLFHSETFEKQIEALLNIFSRLILDGRCPRRE